MELQPPPEECGKKLYDLQSSRRNTKINYNKIQLQVLRNHYTPTRNQLMRNDREQNSEHLMDMHHQHLQGDHFMRNRSLSYSREERDLFGSPQSAVEEGRTHGTGYNRKRENHHLQSQEPSTAKRFASPSTDIEENKDTEYTTLASGDPEKKASNQQGKKINHEQNKNEELRWRCDLCTFLNKTTDKECFLCLCSVIPSSEKDFITSSNALLVNAEAANERVVKPWHCKYCTHMNMWKKDICNLCSTPRDS